LRNLHGVNVKRVLIFTAGFGEGHNTAARNIRDALQEIASGECEAEVVDLFAQCYPRMNATLRRLYSTAINRTPHLWHCFYWILDRLTAAQDRLDGFHDVRGAMERMIRDRGADVLVTVYPVYNFAIAGLEPGVSAGVRTVTVITDSITINSVWLRAECEHYIVPNDLTATVLRNRGVPSGRIHALGFPVQTVFARSEAFGPLPDPEAGPRLLYVVNTGAARAHEVIRLLVGIPWLRLTVSVGRRPTLEAEIRRLAAVAADRVEVMGWTDEMPRLLSTHHAVISKCGGATTQEAIAARCPMIVSRVVPGQEEGNWELLRLTGGGVLATRPKEIESAVREMFADGAAKWRQMRQSLSAIARPDAALRIAGYLLGLS